MPKGPRPKKRRRRAPASATAKVAAPPPPPQGPREYCETHHVEIDAGAPGHESCTRIELSREVRGTKENLSVYFDEGEGTARHRVRMGMEGIDRVLGGGWVRDAMYLLSGEKGAGKSTLLLQVCHAWLSQGLKVLYVSAEENVAKVCERARRLGISMDGRVLHTTSLDDLRLNMERLYQTTDDPDLIIVDSAQTIGEHGPDAIGQIGSVAQSLHVAHVLAPFANVEGRCVILIGQETKSGEAAGSQQAAHLVDAILELRKDGRAARYLTTPKNRHGIDGEVAVLDMTERGLIEIGNATEEQLERRLGDVGIVPFAAASDRPRPVLLAVRASALVIDEDMSARSWAAIGYSNERLKNVLDRLQADCGCFLQGRAWRVHVPNVLGEEVCDHEIDLAVAAALLSVVHNRPVPKALIFGEVGIDGYIDGDKRSRMRLIAARDHKRLKFTDAIIPQWTTSLDGMTVKRIAHMRDLSTALWGVHLAMPRPIREEKAVGERAA